VHNLRCGMGHTMGRDRISARGVKARSSRNHAVTRYWHRTTDSWRNTFKNNNNDKMGNTPDPNGASVSSTQAVQNGRGQRLATQDTGGSARAESDARAPERTHTSPQAQYRLQQKLQTTEQRRQQRCMQLHARSGNSPAKRRKNPEARACRAHELSPHQRNPHEV
jgi:hypothetical protein